MLSKRYIPQLFGALLFVTLAFALVSAASPLVSHSAAQPFPGATPTPLSPQAEAVLDYLTQQYEQPADNYTITYEEDRSFPLLERDFKEFVVWDRSVGKSIHLLVDLATGEVIEDIEALEEKEAELYRAKYGKMDPPLYDQLQECDDDDELSVGMWVAFDTGGTEQQGWAMLAARYPEVREALDRGDSPFALDDHDLAQQVREEYNDFFDAAVQAAVQPVVDVLESWGIDVQTFFMLPSVTATMTKVQILEIQECDAVLLVQSLEFEIGPPEESYYYYSRLPFITFSEKQ